MGDAPYTIPAAVVCAQPLLGDDLAFCADGLAGYARPRPFDDFSTSGKEAGARARQRMVTIGIDYLPTAWDVGAASKAEWQREAQAPSCPVAVPAD